MSDPAHSPHESREAVREASPSEPPIPPWGANVRFRRGVALAVGILFGLALIALTTLIALVSAVDADAEVIVGGYDADQITTLLNLVCFFCITIALCVIPVRWFWLFLVVPARVAAFGAFAAASLLLPLLLALTPTTVTLVSEGCDTGYIVREQSFKWGSGTVYRMDGAVVTPVGRVSGENMSFASGAYTVDADGDTLKVWYRVDDDDSWAAREGEPQLVVPVLPSDDRRCGIEVATPAPVTDVRPPQRGDGIDMSLPANEAVPTATDAGAAVRAMAETSVAAAVGTVRDRDGQPLDLGRVAVQTTECEGGGIRSSMTVEFVTDDNAVSVGSVLRSWDAAGYRADRAMQQDIRYSETAVVERMTIRDRSSIDGAVHVTITSRCALAE